MAESGLQLRPDNSECRGPMAGTVSREVQVKDYPWRTGAVRAVATILFSIGHAVAYKYVSPVVLVHLLMVPWLLLDLCFFVLCLALLAAPLRSYRRVVGVAFLGWATQGALVPFVGSVDPPGDWRHYFSAHLVEAVVILLIGWLILSLFLCLLVLLNERWRPVRKPGCCVKCGYSLRGLVDQRCPECGTPFKERPPDVDQER